MKKKINLLILISFLLITSIIIYSCKDTGTNTLFEFILRTDELGNVLGGDYSDWCYDSIAPGSYALYPAYPNPTDDSVTIQYVIPSMERVKIYFNDRIVKDNKVMGGRHILKIGKGQYQNKLKKLYFKVLVDDKITFECSGDIQFK